MQGHLSQLDPHGDRAYANLAMGGHLTANDPHGDRAYTAAQVKNAFARAYFFQVINQEFLWHPENSARLHWRQGH